MPTYASRRASTEPVTRGTANSSSLQQVLVSHAVRIASQYPPDLQRQYVAAAQTLRQPYWDWTVDPTLPSAVYAVNVTVRAPRGVVEIPNPLSGYRFKRPSVELSFGGFLTTYPQTNRCLAKNILDNIPASNENMLSTAEDLNSAVYDIFARTKTFDDPGWRISSFEFPHSLVHALSVCNGTVSDLNWSAFDPLFMLHHCNVDRLVAMWQVIHYQEAIFNFTASSTGQYVTVAETAITADSPLKPFLDEDMSFHTSNSVATITTFGYTYRRCPIGRCRRRRVPAMSTPT
ncbi:Di-copper centre-containing protein [Parathielavia hyrcaniae]|uniref:tyrosinase n=1 Tax=Parathielavia hyrcaniae TaxID=113614 RepID=A0AAN6T300_9PEZI|nr:Di-copper centre-containing protein [Parathielavia hyrcaniae]